MIANWWSETVTSSRCDVGAELPADLVTPGSSTNERPASGPGGDVAAHSLRERLAVEWVDAVELEAQRVARDDAALDDRHIEVDLWHRSVRGTAAGSASQLPSQKSLAALSRSPTVW